MKRFGKIDLSQQQSDRRHDNAFNERRDDLAKGGADDYRDRQVENITARDEVAKFFDHDRFLSAIEQKSNVQCCSSPMSSRFNVRRFMFSGLLHVD